jgi:MFS family permease
MRLTTLFFITGSLAEALAPSMAVLMIGRLLSGLGSGAAVVVVPIYISEITPSQARGFFGAWTQISINIGILVTQVLGFFFSDSFGGSGWRLVFGVAGCIGVAQFLGLMGVVESPDWLGSKGQGGMARKILSRIRGRDVRNEDAEGWETAGEGEGMNCVSNPVDPSHTADFSLPDYEEGESLLDREPPQGSLSSAQPPRKQSTKTTVGIFQVLTHPDHYMAIAAVVVVMFSQQLCGINSVIIYSVSILRDLLPTAAGVITMAVGVLNLLVTIACAPLSDRLGRKTCLLFSIAGMGINSLFLALGILFGVKILSTLAILLFVASFAVGLGPVPFILANELVGPEAVGATQSWALATNWLATFLVAQFFPILSSVLGKGNVFFVFTAMAAVFFVFVSWWVPETKGKRDADEVWGRERRED